MKQMKKYFRALNESSIPAARRILIFLSLGSAVGSVAVAAILLLSAAKSTYVLIASAFVMINILLTGLAFFGKRYGRTSVLCTVIWNCLMYPFWFFCFDGAESGLNLFFLLGLFFCFALHKGTVRIWLFSISIMLDVVAYLISYYGPEMTRQLGDVVLRSSPLISIIVTGFAIAVVSGMLTSQNEKMRKEAEALKQRVTQLSDYDPMTGIYGEKAFRGVLDDYYKENVLYGVIFFDVDHLAVINARYGAETGNRILQDIAAILKDIMESERLVAKCTGGTFVLVIREENTEYLFDLAQAIRFRIEDELTLPEESETVTVSGGVYCPLTVESPDQVMRCAYENLQKAKEEGYNCVVAS